MDWESPPQAFHYARFERIEPKDNAYRIYLIGWQPTLFGEGAVVRIYGRKGESQRVLFNTFDSLEAAWPFIRQMVKRRLRHRYRLKALI